MKTKNTSGLVVGIVITLFVLILSGTIIIWGSGYFNQNKKIMDKSTSKIDKAIGSMADFDLTIYDGKSIRGDALTELIAELKQENLAVSIGVDTLASQAATNYNYEYTSSNLGVSISVVPTTDKSVNSYINPNGTFIGEVIKNANEDIVYILFTQMP